MTIEGTTTEFELPFGVEKDGLLHTTVVMRRVRNSDLINVSNDRRVKELRREGHTINMSSGADGRVGLGGETNAIAMLTMEGPLAELNATLLGQVILSIGDITQVDKGTIKSMAPADSQCCLEWYQWFNIPPKKRGKSPDEEESKKDPSPDSTN